MRPTHKKFAKVYSTYFKGPQCDLYTPLAYWGIPNPSPEDILTLYELDEVGVPQYRTKECRALIVRVDGAVHCLPKTEPPVPNYAHRFYKATTVLQTFYVDEQDYIHSKAAGVEATIYIKDGEGLRYAGTKPTNQLTVADLTEFTVFPRARNEVRKVEQEEAIAAVTAHYGNTLVNFEHRCDVCREEVCSCIKLGNAPTKVEPIPLCGPNESCCGNDCKNCQNKTVSDIDTTVNHSSTNILEDFKPFSEFEQNVVMWAMERNIILGGSIDAQIGKLEEEFEELKMALLSHNQHEVRDAIGDMNVVLCILAAMRGLRLSDCQRQAWDGGGFTNPATGELEKGIWKRKGRMIGGCFVKEANLPENQ